MNIRVHAGSLWRSSGLAFMFVSGLAATLFGCGGPGAAPSGSPAGSVPGPAVVKAPPAAGYTLALIRMNDALGGEEPPDRDVLDGVIQGGLEAGAVKLVNYDAKGEPAAVPGLVETAIRDGASAILTFRADSTLAATSKELSVPLVFSLTGEPAALGLGKHAGDHRPDVTGAYTSMHKSLIVEIARGCLPKAKSFGLVFDPNNPVSVTCKDALLQTGWDKVEAQTAPIPSESAVGSAVRTLTEKGVNAIILVPGLSPVAARTAIEEARKAKVPAFGFTADHARHGAIVARVPLPRWSGFEAGRRAARILRGEPTKQITWVQGDNYKTHVNPGEAKSLGVTLLGALMRDPVIVSTGEPAAPQKGK